MTVRRSIVPRLIQSEIMIRVEKGRKPRPRHKPLCGKCANPTYKMKIDLGAKYSGEKRFEHVGWFCRTCQIFYYLDGSPDFRGVT